MRLILLLVLVAALVSATVVLSAAAAEPYKDRLLPLPPFLLGAQAGLAPGDVGLGLDLTGHFLETFVFAVMNKPLPPARVWLIDRLRDAERL